MLAFLASDHGRFYGGPMDRLQGWEKFGAYVGQWILRGYGMFAITLRDTGTTIGMAGPYHPGSFPEPEMSWLLTQPTYQGQGFASEACAAVVAHLFETQPWDSFVSFIHRDNAPSRALALRLGAVYDGETPSPFADCETYRHHRTEAP